MDGIELLLDCQSLLIQGFGLLVLALMPVKFSQIVKTACGVRMSWTQPLYIDCQSSPIQWLRFSISSTSMQVESCAIEQANCNERSIWILLDPGGALESMWQQALITSPVSYA